MTFRDCSNYIQDMVKAMDDIQRFVLDMNFEQFMQDDKTSSAVIRKLEIIGEAAKQVSANIREGNPAIPWKEMAGMRDRLIHFYSGVDYRLVWETINQRIPEVKLSLQKYLRHKF